MTTGQREKRFEAPYGNLLRLGERREVAIYMRESTVWVADFKDGHGDLFTAGEWFALNSRSRMLVQAQRRKALDIVSPLPEAVAVQIEHLHRRIAQQSVGAAMRRCASAVSRRLGLFFTPLLQIKPATLIVAFCLTFVSLSVGAVPFFTATAGPTRFSEIGGCLIIHPGDTNSPVPVTAETVCGDSGGGNLGIATADFGHVGVKSEAFVTSLCCISNDVASAAFSDTVTFTGPAATVPVSLNLNFGGDVNSTHEALAEIRADAIINNILVGHFEKTISQGLVSSCTTTFFGAVVDCGTVFTEPVFGRITTSPIMVPVGVLVPFDIFLRADTGAGGIGTSAFARFLDSLDLPTGIDVFNLPDGFTADAPDSFIVNNRFVPPAADGVGAVPEPSSMLLVASVFGLLAMLRRRRA